MLSWTDNEMTYLAGVGDVSTPTRALLSVVLQLGVWPASRPISQQGTLQDVRYASGRAPNKPHSRRPRRTRSWGGVTS